MPGTEKDRERWRDLGPAGQVPALDFDRPELALNDHLVFSKGHASPLLYSMYKAAHPEHPRSSS